MPKLGAALRRAGRYIIKGQPRVEASITYMQPGSALEGRTVLVTGGTRGIGRAIAVRSAAEGASVVIVGRSDVSCNEAAKELGCTAIACDVSSVESLRGIFERAEEAVGSPVDSLVSNAGVSLHEGGFRNVSEEDWDAQMDTNLKAAYFLCQEFVGYIESKGLQGANILVVSSERARRPDDIPYGLTKAATDSFVRAMASGLIRQGIRINGIAPGVTCTDMTGRGRDGNLASWQNNGRFFLPEEVAEVANFLLGDASRCISGEVVACNQGNDISVW